MKTKFALALAMLVVTGCAGIERPNTKHKSDPELKLQRLLQTEFSTMRYGEGAADSRQISRDEHSPAWTI